MPQRRLLTADFVNAAAPPARGELWIADTAVRGFGLRLFASGKRGKSYGIRIRDEFGNPVRKSFDVSESSRFRYAVRRGNEEATFGSILDDARRWARWEISKHKNLDVTFEENRARRDYFCKAVGKITFEKAAEKLLYNLELQGRSRRYIDRLDKLFAHYVPADIKSRPLAEILPQKLAQALVKPGTPFGNLRVLRPFIGQIFERAIEFGARVHDIKRRFDKQYNT